MKELTAIIFLVFGLSITATADIWKWVDDDGNVHYGDAPARADVVNAERVTYKSGSRTSDSRTTSDRGNDDSEDTPEESRDGDSAKAYYCKQATDIYQSYVGAPRLYKLGDDGQRQYLSDEEAAAALTEAEASMAEWCD